MPNIAPSASPSILVRSMEMLCRVECSEEGSLGATNKYGCMSVIVHEGALVDFLDSDLEEDLEEFYDMELFNRVKQFKTTSSCHIWQNW